MRRNAKLLLLGALGLSLVASCSGGGGSGGDLGPPSISAEVITFPPGAAPPGFTNNASVSVVFFGPNASIPFSKAAVSINGVPLAYNVDNQDYEGAVPVSPGDNVALSVSLGGNTYTASATQFTSYPTISAPAAGAFDQTVSNPVTWSGGAPFASATKYQLGVLDAVDPNGSLVWPAKDFLQWVPLSNPSFTIPPTSITGGDRVVIAGIAMDTAIPNAIPGSTLTVAGFNYVPITVSGVRIARHTLAADLSAGKVVWSGSQFVSAGGFGTIITSPDGSTWTTRRSGTEEFFGGIAWSGAKFVVIGSQGASGTPVILTSGDGISWTPSATSGLNGLFSVTWSGTKFVAGGFGVALTSPDGVTWTPNNLPVFGTMTGIAWSGTTFVGVGNAGILTSPDGAVWTPRSGTGSPQAVTWSATQSQFVAVGHEGLVETSPDGVTWTQRSSGTSGELNDVVWTGAQFVAVGSGSTCVQVSSNVCDTVYLGTMITSPDGVNWTPHAVGPTDSFTGIAGIAWSGTTLVMSSGSEVLTSP